MSQVTEENIEKGKNRKDFEATIIAKAWKDEAYKQELLSNPKAVIEREFGVELPEELQVNIKVEDPNNLYFVLPTKPDFSKVELTDEQLEAAAGGTLSAVVGLFTVSTVFLHVH
ncbi:NHLP leader peptide family RiPP precursor [Aetokthonos hydrillicola Thurmond2011]|jgi:hypothetical protein|uniref:NHLP leader peptide family RiPP n=1 Tax=Aetokthonos hydrillicola Thurmond2011 TaxID=2712845 RepID=A0AAP5I8V4_9CYAN|nr:NHLP leader peptide family RiPP precursor [Aetokthonos hydrillicola]MBO3458669.1 NHLP leader peptide family natural product precursor [Aetokthonos hydrillicola CCALA 1050]MBW4588022.1 NHLP leader peptide family RiPP precursor [Aetokthonos hydrillicola CCALA 1050]MDR9897026.1 NHLP leader peptide family RiPP precursor [Aetokthonos hydrillicola Thurmond2011]